MAVVVHRQYFSNHRIYTVDVDGTDITVTVTAVASVARRWLKTTLYLRRHYHRMNRLVVGLGVQWTPGDIDPAADTLQLCVGCRCLIFQIAQSVTVPRCLHRFLANPSHTFVGFWNHSDHRKLESSPYRFAMCRDPLDLRLHAENEYDEDLARAPVEEIVERCLGFEVELRRDVSMSDWDEEYLSKDQVVYACVDAYCAFLIGKDIRAWEL